MKKIAGWTANGKALSSEVRFKQGRLFVGRRDFKALKWFRPSPHQSLSRSLLNLESGQALVTTAILFRNPRRPPFA